jgi:holo-[acyl-carrier protein] synthase
VKEAVSKALGCGLGADLGWQEVELRKDREGRPSVQLAGDAYERHDRPEFAVSVAHDGDYAVAFVVLRERNPM